MIENSSNNNLNVRKQIDWKIVDELLKIHAPGTEIAAYLGIHRDTLYDRCRLEKGMPFAEYLQEKQAIGKVILRKGQWNAAAGDGNITMLIWLGKQHLDQKEKKDIEINDIRLLRDYLEAYRKSSKGLSGDSQSTVEIEQSIQDQGCIRQDDPVSAELGTNTVAQRFISMQDSVEG